MQENTSSIIKVDGSLSRRIAIERGVRQADPLAALLFILAIEPLLPEISRPHQVRSSGKRNVSAYADHIACLTKGSSAETLFDIIDAFCNATQLEINREKTVVV